MSQPERESPVTEETGVKATKEATRRERADYRLSGIVKLIAENGTARILIAAGVLIPLTFLYRIPSDDWQANVVLLIVSLFLVGAGTVIRVSAMKHGQFSGRTMLLRCGRCKRVITKDVDVGSPPTTFKCGRSDCGAINIIQ